MCGVEARHFAHGLFLRADTDQNRAVQTHLPSNDGAIQIASSLADQAKAVGGFVAHFSVSLYAPTLGASRGGGQAQNERIDGYFALFPNRNTDAARVRFGHISGNVTVLGWGDADGA